MSNKGLEQLMIEILKEEVKPATGCTEPVAVAYAAAVAVEALRKNWSVESKLSEIDIRIAVSPNLFKNGLGVGIPNCEERGLVIAAALGMVACQAKDGLKVFENMTADRVSKASEMAKSGAIKLGILDTDEKIGVEVTLTTPNGDVLQLSLAGKHDRIAYIKWCGNTIMEAGEMASTSASGLEKSDFFDLSIRQLVAHVESLDTGELDFLIDGLEMNRRVASAGLEKPMGMGVGFGLKTCIEEGQLGSDLVTKAMMLTAAASDARMSGLNMTVMSSNGSGNNGLTAILPLAAYFESHEVSVENQKRALAMSHLINCYMKERIGRLSAMCSCAISAATGSGAAIAWLMSGDVNLIEATIQNMTGNLSGMICDGAKEGCAMKLATGAATGVQSALLAKHHVVMPSANGIVGRSVEESIEHLGKLSHKGMQLTDGVILEMMKEMI